MQWLKDNWITVSVVAVIVFVLWSTMGRRKQKVTANVEITMRCPKCGWAGMVSKYAIQCRKCGNKNMNMT